MHIRAGRTVGARLYELWQAIASKCLLDLSFDAEFDSWRLDASFLITKLLNGRHTMKRRPGGGARHGSQKLSKVHRRLVKIGLSDRSFDVNGTVSRIP